MRPLFRYFAAEVWNGWRANPFVPLAKMAAVGFLAGTAALILVLFDAFVGNAQARLGGVGANSIVILNRGANPTDWLSHVAATRPFAVRHQVRRLAILVTIPPGRTSIPVYAIETNDAWFLSAAAGRNAVLVTAKDPGLQAIEVEIGNTTLLATIRRGPDWVDKLGADSALFIPQDRVAQFPAYTAESLDYLEIAGGRDEMRFMVGALRTLGQDSGEAETEFRHPLGILDEIERLTATQQMWASWIVVGFGGMLALIIGAIAALEYRDLQYTGALLRSFGVHPGLVVLRHWLEAALVSNASLCFALAVTLQLAPAILVSLGVPEAVAAGTGFARFIASNGLPLLLCVNLGALFSAVPSMVAAREEVGRVLK